jgi:hypothetical protein
MEMAAAMPVSGVPWVVGEGVAAVLVERAEVVTPKEKHDSAPCYLPPLHATTKYHTKMSMPELLLLLLITATMMTASFDSSLKEKTKGYLPT